jgi:hypothetical protein
MNRQTESLRDQAEGLLEHASTCESLRKTCVHGAVSSCDVIAA